MFQTHTHSVSSGNGTHQVSNKWLKEEQAKQFKEVVQYKYFGLGDVIDFFTRYTGLKAIIMWATNGNCGCEERRKRFNKIFSIRLGKKKQKVFQQPKSPPIPEKKSGCGCSK